MIVAGCLLEVLTGFPYGAPLERELFKRIGMDDGNPFLVGEVGLAISSHAGRPGRQTVSCRSVARSPNGCDS